MHGSVILEAPPYRACDRAHGGYLCFHFGEGGEDHVKTAYEMLKDEAIACSPLDKCDYSSLEFVCTDKFGVTWCIFV